MAVSLRGLRLPDDIIPISAVGRSDGRQHCGLLDIPSPAIDGDGDGAACVWSGGGSGGGSGARGRCCYQVAQIWRRDATECIASVRNSRRAIERLRSA